MTNKKPLVIVTRKLLEATETRMAELFNVRLNETDQPMSRLELIAAVREADILVPTVTDRIDAAVLAEAGDQLKMIASYSMGVDHIDLAAARARNIAVNNTAKHRHRHIARSDNRIIERLHIIAATKRLARAVAQQIDLGMADFVAAGLARPAAIAINLSLHLFHRRPIGG